MNLIRKSYTTGMPHVDLAPADIPADKLIYVEHDGTKIVVMRSRERFYAFHNACPHAFWPLSEGSLQNGVLECAGHGWEFSVETGRCLNAPVYCLTPVSVTLLEGSVRLEWSDTSASTAAPKVMHQRAG